MKIRSKHFFIAAASIMVASLVGIGQHALALQAQAPPATAKPLMVDDVFKNVQALKGISVDDFLLTMGIMCAAVGSDCVGCQPAPIRSTGLSTPRENGPPGAWCRWCRPSTRTTSAGARW
jgi:hypothetical protein